MVFMVFMASGIPRGRVHTTTVACVASVSVGFGSKELQRENGASKRRGWGGEERKETLADKPLDFENRPHAQ